MQHPASPPLPNMHALSISPYPRQPTDYPYPGVFGPPAAQPLPQPSHSQQGWNSPNKRGSRSGLPPTWYDPSPRDSPVHFEPYRRDSPALSPQSSNSGAASSFQQYPAYGDPSFGPLGVTPSPPPMHQPLQPPPQYAVGVGQPTPVGAPYNPLGGYAQPPPPPQQQQPMAWRGYPPIIPTPDDDTIPTAIVIKNIPFAVSKETLEQVIRSLGAPLPYAFNYHLDNGVFRGLAFANFRAHDEAAAVVAALNGYDVQGRKLRVEYKKVLQPGEKDKIEREKALKRMRSIQFDKDPTTGGVTVAIPPPISVNRANGYLSASGGIDDQSPPHSASSATSDSLPVTLDFNDPLTLDIHTRIAVFKEDRMRDELAFSRNLSPTERRIVHLVAQKLGVTSTTKGEGEVKYVVVTRDVPRPSLTSSASATVSTSYLSPYATNTDQLSPSLRVKKSMPDLRGFNGPVVARDPARSITPQRSSGNLRENAREYVSMGAAHGRRANGQHSHGGSGSGSFNTFFGNPLDIPPVPPLPSGLGLQRNSMPSMHGTALAQAQAQAQAQAALHQGMNGHAHGGSPELAGPDGSSSGSGSTPAPLRNPRGPAGDARGFHTVRPSASGILRTGNGGGLSGRVSEEEEEQEGARTRESLEI